MAQRWLIDGSNALHERFSERQLSHDLAGAMRQLITEICNSTSIQNQSVTIFFDGRRPGPIDKPKKIQIIFSGTQSTDDRIIQLIKKSSRSTQWIVCTNDRELKQRARSAGATTRSTKVLTGSSADSISNKLKNRRSTSPSHSGTNADISLTDNEAKTLADLWNLKDDSVTDS